MRISTKSRHAITAMLELALQDRPMKLSMISDNNAISISYLEQIFAAMRFKGLVKGQRGPGGGYILGKQPEDISIAEIISSVDEWVEYHFSKPKMVTPISYALNTQILWNDLSHQIYNFLESISLADVVENGSAFQDLLNKAA
jgi:Rrf2 family transcriptional regulator, iron-sulfur cluster assembly transcription factor